MPRGTAPSEVWVPVNLAHLLAASAVSCIVFFHGCTLCRSVEVEVGPRLKPLAARWNACQTCNKEKKHAFDLSANVVSGASYYYGVLPNPVEPTPHQRTSPGRPSSVPWFCPSVAYVWRRHYHHHHHHHQHHHQHHHRHLQHNYQYRVSGG